MVITRPRGTNDFLPAQTAQWQMIEALLRELAEEYGYGEIRTPLFEETELFVRGVGDSTDIVQKEMYTFQDQGGRSLTLRPENTVNVCRAYLENKLYGQPQPQRFYYIGPMFRYERPQAGRFRQFHQFGIELLGAGSPYADAEVIAFGWELCHRLGLQGLELLLNTVGCPDCRPAYRQALQDYFRPHLAELCPSCQDRFQRNPLRLLDCKKEHCQAIAAAAPRIEAYLCAACTAHFAELQEILTATGLAFTIKPQLVRGLDYYTNTAFEIVSGKIGAQGAVLGGGRYNGLMQQVGGDPCPACGFALGMERIFNVLQAYGESVEVVCEHDVYLVTDGSKAAKLEGFALVTELRRLGLRAELDLLERGFKAQLKAADRLGSRLAVILGEAELQSGQAQVKDMQSGEQTAVPLASLKQYLLER